MTRNPWVVEASELPIQQDDVLESVFALGNGAFGVRGVSPLARRGVPATVLAGVHSEVQPYALGVPALGSLHRDSVGFPDDRDIWRRVSYHVPAAPNPFAMRIKLGGHIVHTAISCRRSLDMRCGILRSELELLCAGGAAKLVTTRLASIADHCLAAERIEITAARGMTIEVSLECDATGSLAGGLDLWDRRKAGTRKDALSWDAVAAGTGAACSVAMQCVASRRPSARYASESLLRFSFSAKLQRGKPLVLDRFVAIATSAMDRDPAAAARRSCARAARMGFAGCLAGHADGWKRFWKQCDISIDGPADEQKAVRYCIFQVRSALPPVPGSYSVGPNFLAGTRYKNLVFWDMDAFILPYLSRTQPEAARSHVLFRHRGLPGALKLAGEYGLRGARYPWQAMADGSEGLDRWNIFAPNQVHVTADVAWGVWDYVRWTGDTEFMKTAGAAILAETARFWMSRMTRTRRGLEILSACGPDEAHPSVDNNTFTNMMAAHNLRVAAEFSAEAGREKRASWIKAAGELFIHRPDARGRIEQFDGFFDLPPAPAGSTCTNSEQYRHVKQADLIMVPAMLPGALTRAQVRANYDYYEAITSHESSLSAGIHSIVASRAGRPGDAYNYFITALFTDLHNLHKNTQKGLHSAATAVALRAVIEGFAGLEIGKSGPVLSPSLPRSWKALRFGFYHGGKRFKCLIKRTAGGKIEAAIRRSSG